MKNIFTLKNFLFFFFLFSFSSSFAQPVNDNCSSSSLLCPNISQPASNVNATTECGGADSCAFGLFCYTTENSVWFHFVTNSIGGDATVSVSGFSGSMQGTLISASVPCNSSSYNKLAQACDSVSIFSLAATGLSPNTTYWVQVDGVSGNQSNFQIVVFGAAVQWTVNINTTDETCVNSCDGFITAAPQSGTSPYTYQWDAAAGNQITQTATGLCAGNYNITVTDSAGCSTLSTATTGTKPPATISTSSNNVKCETNCTGTATATLSSGQTPFSYQWNTVPAQTSQTATGLCADTFSVTVTDAVNCKDSDSVIITEPPPITNVSVSTTPVACAKLGTASASVSGGTSPYAYEWSNGEKNPAIGELSPGFYSLTITDKKNCEKIVSASITEEECTLELNPLPKFSPNGDDINDKWVIGNAEAYPKNEVFVYDRWGQRVYTGKGYNNVNVVWDGKYLNYPVPDAVYYFIIYKDRDKKNDEIPGSVIILR